MVACIASPPVVLPLAQWGRERLLSSVMNRTPNSIWIVRMGELSCQPAPAPFGGHQSATPPLVWWPPPLPVFRAARTPARDGRPSRGRPHRILPRRSPPSSGRELIRQTSRRPRRYTASRGLVSPSRRTLWLPARRRRPRATRSARPARATCTSRNLVPRYKRR